MHYIIIKVKRDDYMFEKCKHGLSVFLDVLASCLMPLIPMLIAASMFKTLAAILGPDMLHWIDASSSCR